MGVPGNANALLLRSAAAAGGYQVSRSLRFNSSDSAYLSRTPASTGNRKTWTWAGWVKRSGLGTDQALFSVPQGGGYPNTGIVFNSSNQLRFFAADASTNVFADRVTSAVYRDTSAWMHIVVAVDYANTQAKIYVNGSEITAFATSTGPTNTDGLVNASGTTHVIGQFSNTWYFSGYLADIHFIDGQALTPSSFTEVSATTGQLIPKAYTGSFGTNGFWLQFADNSNNTATTLGKDTANSNNWTPNNFYVSNTVYSSGVSITGSYANNTNARMAFDGSISTKLEMSGSNNQITFTPPAAISFSSTVEVYLTPTGDVTYTRYSFNNGADTAFSAGDGWKTVASGGGTFTSLVLKQGAQSNNIGFAAIRINGSTILVDASSADNDSLVDTPTSYGTDTGAGGEVRGNYATWNAIDKSTNVTLSNGNLDTLHGGAGHTKAVGNIYASSGKWYAEFTLATVGGNVPVVGINSITLSGRDTYVGSETGSFGYSISALKYSGSAPAGTAYGATFTAGDIIGVALDLDTGTLTFYKNGVSQGTAYTGLSGTFTFAVSGIGSSASWVANFGQRPFAYTAPSGFKALCDTNLPAPVVAKPSTVMDVIRYTGTGANATIPNVNTVPTSIDFTPDLVWIKGRSGATDHALYDSVRDVQKDLASNSTAAETTQSTSLTAFGTNTFTIGSLAKLNTSSATYAAWCWDAGTTTDPNNTAGSITSSVRANASAGFSVATFNTGSSGVKTVGHGLNVAPSFFVIKSRSISGQWAIYHASLGYTQYMLLHSTSAAITDSGQWVASPTSSVFSFNSGYSTGANVDYVGYFWAPVTGYTSAGSYTGNGSADGPFVYTSMRPRWILLKRTDSTGNWTILDTAREGYNVDNDPLYPNLANAEGTADLADILSNGFKLRSTDASVNASAGTYIYFAISEAAFQYARAR